MLFVTVWAYVPVQSVSAAEAQSADSAGVYVFQDAKKEGTVTVINRLMCAMDAARKRIA